MRLRQRTTLTRKRRLEPRNRWKTMNALYWLGDVRSHGAVETYHRSSLCPAQAPTAVTTSVASEYQVATNSGESSKQWKA